jgi:superfamily I DNA/RNA helicase
MDEAQLLMKIIKADGPEGWAVLARTNRLLDVFEVTLRSEEIPCHRVGGKNFWEGQEPAMFLGLLKSLKSGDGVGELLALHWSGISKDLLDTVKNGSASWCDIVEHIGELPDNKLDKAGQKVISTFLKRRQDWEEALRLGRYRLVISGVAAWCRGFIKDDRRKGKENRESRSDIFQLCEDALNRMRGPIEMRIYSLTKPYSEKGDNPQGVQLMTIHNSKGLEFPNVWVVAAEENTLPHLDSTVDEERRLCYVAMTRAEQRLVLSFSAQDVSPSRFLSEAGIQPKF